MQDIQVSIIVAIYNAEKWLHRCLESIKMQSFQNYEVLLIDDGSTDTSYKICKEYASIDKRFKAFHKDNEGVGATRQMGISLAQGKYSIHIDPDDWIDSDMIQSMYDVAESQNAEIVICDIIEEYKDHTMYRAQKTKSPFGQFSFEDIISGDLWGGMVNKLILCSLYKDNNICFSKDVFREDVRFLADLLPKANIFAYIPRGFYHYDKETNTECLTKSNSKKRLEFDFCHYRWLINENYITPQSHLWIYKEFADYSYTAFANQFYTHEEYLRIFDPSKDTILPFLDTRKKVFVFMNLHKMWGLSVLIYGIITKLKRIWKR